MADGSGVTRLDSADPERNRELLAQRMGWPLGALDECREFEREFTGWYAWWSPAHGGYGASPAYGLFIRQRTHYSPTAEGLRTLVRQDIQRHRAEQERSMRPRRAAPAAGMSPER